MYDAHPSLRLHELFRDSPHQGAAPERADLVVLGLDANYAADLDARPRLFSLVERYHRNGVEFWRSERVHHPFVHQDYPGDRRRDGVPYHRNFAEIGFGPQHAHRISFIEVLDLPTTGQSRLVPADLDRAHLARLAELMRSGRRCTVLVCSDVILLLRKVKDLFWWLPPPLGNQVLPVLHQTGHTVVRQHLHFSTHGKDRARRLQEAQVIRALLEDESRPHGPSPMD